MPDADPLAAYHHGSVGAPVEKSMENGELAVKLLLIESVEVAEALPEPLQPVPGE